MPDDTDEITFDANGDAVLNPRIREHMRKQEQQLKEAEAKLRESDLRVSYAELGIPNEKAGKFFRDNYRGDTDVESVRKAAFDAGVLDSTPTPRPNETDNQDPAAIAREAELRAELDQLRRVNGASGNAGDEGGGGSLVEMLSKLRAAKTADEFDAIVDSDEMRRLGATPISTFQ